MLATGADFANTLSFDVQSVAALRSKAAANDPAALKAAAKEFEAMFIQTMLKTMRQTSFTEQGDVFGDSSSLKLYRQLLDQQWAQSIANGKGLGLADLIIQRLKQQSADLAPQAGTAPRAAADDAAAKAASADSKTDMATVVRQEAAAPSAAPAPVQSGSTDRTDENGSRSAGKEADAGQGTDRKTRFVEAMLPYAREAEKESGVPARFVLAQAALESGWGSREIVSADGTTSHNLFGIKAGGSWGGGVVTATTTEYRQGLPMKVQAKFRAYAGYAEAFVDYANLLKRRFRAAVAAGSNARAFATGLVKGGYATDPRYAEKLQGTIHSIVLAGA